MLGSYDRLNLVVAVCRDLQLSHSISNFSYNPLYLYVLLRQSSNQSIVQQISYLFYWPSHI